MVNQLLVISAPSEEWLTFFYVWLQQQLDSEYNNADQWADIQVQTDTTKYVKLTLHSIDSR